MAPLPGRDLMARSDGPLQWIRAGPAGVLAERCDRARLLRRAALWDNDHSASHYSA